MLPLLQLVMGEGGQKFLGYAADLYPEIDVPALMMMFGDRNRLDRLWHGFLTDYDVLLLPTWAHPPFELGADIASLDGALATLDSLRPVVPANLFGIPAAVVPVGTADGMPVGAQLVGRRFADLTVLRAAETLEQHFGTMTPIDPVW